MTDLDPTAQRIIDFLAEIGLAVALEPLSGETFLPGVALRNGGLVVDPEKLAYPGDLLHEAGHLAVMTPDERAAMDGDVGVEPAQEMAAIAWSYAAAVHLGLPGEVVFHADGYKGAGASILESFRDGGVGVPMLAWFGMTAEPIRAEEQGVPAFPRMTAWLRT